MVNNLIFKLSNILLANVFENFLSLCHLLMAVLIEKFGMNANTKL